MRARPSATERKSPPPERRSGPKRSANRARTEGTKAVPPVRNTRSMAEAGIAASARAASTVFGEAGEIGRDPAFEIGAGDDVVEDQVLVGEAEAGGVRSR